MKKLRDLKNLGLLFKLQPGRKFFIKWSMILKIACGHFYVTEKLRDLKHISGLLFKLQP